MKAKLPPPGTPPVHARTRRAPLDEAKSTTSTATAQETRAPTATTTTAQPEPAPADASQTKLVRHARQEGSAREGTVSTSAGLRGAAAMPSLSHAKLTSLADEAHAAMRGGGFLGLFGSRPTLPGGLGVDKQALFAALTQLGPSDGPAFAALYQQRFGASFAQHLSREHLLDGDDKLRATALVEGKPTVARAIELKEAFGRGDAGAVRAVLKGGTVESNAALMNEYRAQTGRDLEYDMRGFAPSADLGDGQISLRGGLKGQELAECFALLHGPRVRQNAERIFALTKEAQPLSAAQQRELYGMLQQAGGEERTLLAQQFSAVSGGGDLTSSLKPILADAVRANDARPLTSPPEKTVAIVVSSGNWQQMLDGKHDKAIGGFHWREIEAYVKEALDNGYTPVFFTPDGLPPSPDALSLLQGKLAPRFGFGLMAGTGADSAQGKAILEGLLQPRSMASFEQADFATMHIAGGHGSHHDIVGHPHVERAGLALNDAGKPVSAVCHATPALGKLLSGHNATGFSPQFDAVMSKAGYVLPEFQPTFDAHAGLRALGAKVSTVGAFNIHHTERFDMNGDAVMTGTGPEATDNVARQMFAYLAEHQKTPDVPRFTSGPSKGKPVDTSVKQSARQLSPAEAAKFHPKAGEIVVEGFHHGGKLYTAVIPADAIKRVDFHTENYPDSVPLVDVGAHNQLRFFFEPGRSVRLYEAPPATPQSAPAAALDQLVFSVEGLHAKGEQPFDAASVASLTHGMKGEFVTAYRMTSLSQRQSEMHNTKDRREHTVDQQTLSLSKADAGAILRGLVDEATLAGVQRPFHSLKRNCLTELLRVIDKVQHRSQGLVPDGMVPHLGEQEMRKRGLVAKDLGRVAAGALG